MRKSASIAVAVAIAGTSGAQEIVLNFDELGLPHGTELTDQYSDLGVIFSPLYGVIEIRDASWPLFPAEPQGAAEIPYFTSVIIVDFEAPAGRAGAWIDFGEVGQGVQLEAFDGPMGSGELLAIATTRSQELLAVEVEGIRSVVFSNVSDWDDTAYLIDNFTFEPEATLELYGPIPGVAGALNRFEIHGATPGSYSFLAWALRAGTTEVPTCPNLALDLQSPTAVAGQADSEGVVNIICYVRPEAAEWRVLFQAIDPRACLKSPRHEHRFE